MLRYVKRDGAPKEAFLTFLPNTGHKAQELYSAVMNALDIAGINLRDCRGQSYDNAANMAGAYTGLQARIKAVNEYAEFVPCAAHSLNLVGTAAASCCAASTNYFMFVQAIFNFFSGTTTRWEKLNANELELTVEGLCPTRWSRRSDACKALLKSWKPIRDTQKSISNDSSEKTYTKAEATGLAKKMSDFNIAFLTVFWGKILNRINVVRKKVCTQGL